MKGNISFFRISKKLKLMKDFGAKFLFVALFVAVFSGINLANSSIFAAAGDSPCPEGAPVRKFEISAIAVSIVYNNFGDVDAHKEGAAGSTGTTKSPGGKMFALERQSYNGGKAVENPYNSSEKIQAAVKANLTTPSYEVQPIVMRCNVGDCVEIKLTNKDLAKASIMIRRAQYNVLDAEGNLVGNNDTPGSVDPGKSHTYTFYIEDKAENQGAYHIGVMSESFIDLSYSGLWGALIAEPKGSRYLAGLNPWKADGETLFSSDSFATSETPLTWSDWEAIIVPCEGVNPGESPSCDRIFNSPGAFKNGVSKAGKISMGGEETDNPLGAFREAVSFFHDGTFMEGGRLNQPEKKMAFPVRDSAITEKDNPKGAVILPVKGEHGSSGLWEVSGGAGGGDGGSVWGERYAYTTHAGILGTRGWPMMGPSGPVDPKQAANNNTSWNDDQFLGVKEDDSGASEHKTNFGKSFNYRSDPFSYLKAIDEDESQSYSSYTYGEPSTACPQAYVGDPMIWRIVHGGGEEHHVFHPHGFTRWAEQPYEEHISDPFTGEVIKKDGKAVHGSRMYMRGIWKSKDGNLTESLERSAALLKHRKDTRSTASNTVDVAMIAPQEVFDVEFECGAGSCHGGAGDWVEHCHVADHYTIGMWRYMRIYGTRQSNLAALPGRPVPAKAVNSIEMLSKGETPDGKSFCSQLTDPECPDVENDKSVNLEAWVKHLLPSRGVQRTGAPDPRLHHDEKNEDSEWRNPAYDPFDANRNGIAQDIDGDGMCLSEEDDEHLSINDDGEFVVTNDGTTTVVRACADGGDPADWIINPPCGSLDGSFDASSVYGQMSMEGLRALTCIINGYDGDHFDWKIVDTSDGPLVLNQPDGPLFQNFIEGIGDPQGRWARYRDAVMYEYDDGEAKSLGSVGPRPGVRAELMFNPQDGRLEFPIIRPLRGMRPPFPPNNHSGAPTLGETSTISVVEPDATRAEAVKAILNADKKDLGKYPDGLCPKNAPVRSYDIVATVALNIAGTAGDDDKGIVGVIYNRFGDTDPNAVVHSLRNDEVDILAHKRAPEQLAIRCNVGDCVDVQFRSHATDFNPVQDNFSKLNMHIHMVHFDVGGSDGVIVGANWEQSVRPCTDIGQVVDLVSAAKDTLGPKFLGLAEEMQYTKEGPPALGAGEGPTHNVIVPDAEEGIDPHENFKGVSPIGIARTANALNWSGRPWEYSHYRWYADIQMMAFWHPHIGGFIAFPLGTADGTIVEPEGSVYRDRITGEEKYTYSDKVTQNPLIAALGLGDGLRNDKASKAESGTEDGFPMLKDAGISEDFGGNPVLGWALGMLDYEEKTKAINLTAKLNNRKVETGEDIHLFGKVDFRGGPSGLAADDCGGITPMATLGAVVDVVVLGKDPADVAPTLKPEIFLKHTGGACTGDDEGDLITDDSDMGSLASKATKGKEGTLDTNRIFNRTNSIYDVDPAAFTVKQDSGNTESVDVITTSDNDLNQKAEPSFRETVFWWMDDIYLMYGEGTSHTPFDNRETSTNGVSAITLRNEPLDRRMSLGELEQHKVFTSGPKVGDPSTPMLLANPGDRYIIRTFVGGTQDMHAFRFLGHRFGNERHNAKTNPIDTFQNGIGYFNSYELMGGAGASFIDKSNKQHNMPGDYLYYLPIGALDLSAGAWGLLRVDEEQNLQKLDDTGKIEIGGDPCEARTVAEIRKYDITAVSVKGNPNVDQAKNIFVLADSDGQPNQRAVEVAQPLALRVAAGECVEITLHPHHLEDAERRVSLTCGLLVGDPKNSYGVNVGKNLDNGGTDQTVGSAANEAGKSVTYKWLANNQATYDFTNPDVKEKGGAKSWAGKITGEQEKELGTALLASMVDPLKDLNEGLFGALIVEPKGSTWKPAGGPMGGVVADVTDGDGNKFKEFVLIMHETSRRFASSIRPQGRFLGAFNYRASGTSGPPFVDVDPGLVFTAKAGTPTRVRLIYANGSEDRTFTMNGHRWGVESATEGARSVSVVAMGPGMRYDIELEGSSVDNPEGQAQPGLSSFPGDYFFGVAEIRSTSEGEGQWGVIRVVDKSAQIVSAIKVEPKAAKKSILLKNAMVSVLDDEGQPMVGVTVNAEAIGGAVVKETSAVTDAEGKATFKFRFPFRAEKPAIVFSVEGASETLVVKAKGQKGPKPPKGPKLANR